MWERFCRVKSALIITSENPHRWKTIQNAVYVIRLSQPSPISLYIRGIIQERNHMNAPIVRNVYYSVSSCISLELWERGPLVLAEYQKTFFEIPGAYNHQPTLSESSAVTQWLWNVMSCSLSLSQNSQDKCSSILFHLNYSGTHNGKTFFYGTKFYLPSEDIHLVIP